MRLRHRALCHIAEDQIHLVLEVVMVRLAEHEHPQQLHQRLEPVERDGAGDDRIVEQRVQLVVVPVHPCGCLERHELVAPALAHEAKRRARANLRRGRLREAQLLLAVLAPAVLLHPAHQPSPLDESHVRWGPNAVAAVGVPLPSPLLRRERHEQWKRHAGQPSVMPHHCGVVRRCDLWLLG
eukprot:7386479-Prymnesium_polylepis.3